MCTLGAALFSRIFAINSSDQKKILARLKKWYSSTRKKSEPLGSLFWANFYFFCLQLGDEIHN